MISSQSKPTSEELRKLHGQDNSLLQGLLRALQPGDVVPLHVGLLPHDRGVKPGPELGLLGILAVSLAAVLGLCLGPRGDGSVPVGGRAGPTVVEDGADLLGTAKVLGEFLGDGFLDLRVLLVLEMRLEVLQGVHVQREGLRVVPSIVFLHRLLHVLYRLLLEIAIHPLLLTPNNTIHQSRRIATLEETLELHRHHF